MVQKQSSADFDWSQPVIKEEEKLELNWDDDEEEEKEELDETDNPVKCESQELVAKGKFKYFISLFSLKLLVFNFF